VPSPSAASAWLERFHDLAAPKAVAGSAVIPAVTEQLRGLWQVNQALLGCIQTHQLTAAATVVALIFLKLAGGDCVTDLETYGNGQRLRGGPRRDRA
jgi:hypothetical protein